jgi:hypothetical protein
LDLGEEEPAPRRGQLPIRRNAPAPAAVAQELPPVFLYVDGKEAGPYPVERVPDMIRLGAVSTEALYWREGMEEWRSVSEL